MQQQHYEYFGAAGAMGRTLIRGEPGNGMLMKWRLWRWV
jgi:hypothetical protein